MAVTTQALRGDDGSIVATWVHDGDRSTLVNASHRTVGTVSRGNLIGREHVWSGHRVGDGRRPRRFTNREDAMTYVKTRCGY